jgi:hypothetical protein
MFIKPKWQMPNGLTVVLNQYSLGWGDSRNRTRSRGGHGFDSKNRFPSPGCTDSVQRSNRWAFATWAV